MAIVNATGPKVEERILNIKFPKGSAAEQKLETYMHREDIPGTDVLRRAVDDLFLLDELIDDRVAEYATKYNLSRVDFLKRAISTLIASDAENATETATDNAAGE